MKKKAENPVFDINALVAAQQIPKKVQEFREQCKCNNGFSPLGLCEHGRFFPKDCAYQHFPAS